MALASHGTEGRRRYAQVPTVCTLLCTVSFPADPTDPKSWGVKVFDSTHVLKCNKPGPSFDARVSYHSCGRRVHVLSFAAKIAEDGLTNGKFLVREQKRNQVQMYCLSLVHKGKVTHHRITQTDGRSYIGASCLPSWFVYRGCPCQLKTQQHSDAHTAHTCND